MVRLGVLVAGGLAGCRYGSPEAGGRASEGGATAAVKKLIGAN